MKNIVTQRKVSIPGKYINLEFTLNRYDTGESSAVIAISEDGITHFATLDESNLRELSSAINHTTPAEVNERLG